MSPIARRCVCSVPFARLEKENAALRGVFFARLEKENAALRGVFFARLRQRGFGLPYFAEYFCDDHDAFLSVKEQREKNTNQHSGGKRNAECGDYPEKHISLAPPLHHP
jgi:hypothetical protein